MGTSTIFKRMNDLGRKLSQMSKEELEKIDDLSPWGDENKHGPGGWSIEMELHNGNIYPLIFWHGRIFKLSDAPRILSKKYYHKYAGKYLREYEWTLLKKYLERELKQLDKEFKSRIRKGKRKADSEAKA